MQSFINQSLQAYPIRKIRFPLFNYHDHHNNDSFQKYTVVRKIFNEFRKHQKSNSVVRFTPWVMVQTFTPWYSIGLDLSSSSSRRNLSRPKKPRSKMLANDKTVILKYFLFVVKRWYKIEIIWSKINSFRPENIFVQIFRLLIYLQKEWSLSD